MTVDEAKAHQKAIMDARSALNQAIRAGKDSGVYSELEIIQITRHAIGESSDHYDVVDVRCFVDPTKLE